MGKKSKEESSSSEDEACMEALREATDQNFLKNSFFNDDKPLKNDSKMEQNKTDSKNKKSNNVENEDLQEYENHGLSQSCRDFIAKKLYEKLERETIFVDGNTEPKKQNNQNFDEEVGIKLFSSSNTILKGQFKTIDSENYSNKRKKSSNRFNEKDNLKKCKKVAVSPEKIISQEETKFWTSRKIHEPFKYKKLKNGSLVEIKQ